jgi:transcriptional regulator with XRE-family HTH domain
VDGEVQSNDGTRSSHHQLALVNERISRVVNKVLCLGDTIRRRRMDLGLRQKDVAEIIKCDTDTITNWEKRSSLPDYLPYRTNSGFLGYNPFSKGTTLAERSIQARHRTRQIGQRPLGSRTRIAAPAMAASTVMTSTARIDHAG